MRLTGAITVLLVLWTGGLPLKAQSILDLSGQKNICSFFPGDVIEEQIYSFSSSNQAKELVKQIMTTIELAPRFKVYAANVPNAAAVIDDNERLILYSESWVQNKLANNRWSAVALLAHELAHHLNGHTLQEGGSRPLTELEADKFAGFAVGKMGGNLADAQRLFHQLSALGSATHPPRSARLEAAAVGWRNATKGTKAIKKPIARSVAKWLLIAGSYPSDQAYKGQSNAGLGHSCGNHQLE